MSVVSLMLSGKEFQIQYKNKYNEGFVRRRSMNRPGAPYNNNNKSVRTIKQNSFKWFLEETTLDIWVFIVSSLSKWTPRSRTHLTGWVTEVPTSSVKSWSLSLCNIWREPNQINSVLIALSWRRRNEHHELLQCWRAVRAYETSLTGILTYACLSSA